MKVRIHRKLTKAQIERLRKEALMRASLISYKRLAAETGLTHGSIKQLMAELMREIKLERPKIHRGTDRGKLAMMEFSA